MSDENSHRLGFPNEQPPVSIWTVVKLFSLKGHSSLATLKTQEHQRRRPEVVPHIKFRTILDPSAFALLSKAKEGFRSA